jgi:glutathione S-transferase
MKLYSNTRSRSNTILPLLKELGIEQQVEIIEIPYEHMHEAEYLKINPMGKVPCFVDGDSVVSETAAIYAYLADKYIDKGLAPALNDPKRGEYLKWLFFCHGPLTEYMDMKSVKVTPEQMDAQKTGLSFGNEDILLDFIKIGLSRANPYLTGAQFTAADLYLAYWIAYAVQFKILPYLDEFDGFFQRVKKRESVQDIEWLQKL